MKYQWLLFDADGTLFDYDRAEAAALAGTFVQSGLDFEPACAQIYRRINADIWLEFERGAITAQRLRTRRFELLFAALGLSFDAEEFSARYLRNLGGETYLMAGAEDLIKGLYGRAGLVVVTNGLTDVQRSRLSRSSISRYLTDVVISEEIGAAKPDRRFFDIAFRRMGQPPKSDVLIVGDSLTSDIRGGSDYGIDTCWFNPGRLPRPAGLGIRYEIGKLREVRHIVDSMPEGEAG
jgi:2-haloacid dehalogenase